MQPGAAVAFFRNLNLGQGVSPTRTQLLDAFVRAGARDASSFQVNGTVVFESGDDDPQVVGERVVAELTRVTGYADAVLVRALSWLANLPLEEVAEGAELSVYDADGPFPHPLPWPAPKGDLHVVRADERHALSVNAVLGRSQATPTLEAVLGVPVTSRGVPTLQRLLARYAAG